jgi:hypothetical protein
LLAPELPLLHPDRKPYFQLLDSYFEAYQHTLDPEERFALAQAMTDIMHRRPKFDLSHSYFTKAYRDDCTCLRLHLQLVRGILSHHVSRTFSGSVWKENGRPKPEIKVTFFQCRSRSWVFWAGCLSVCLLLCTSECQA